MTETRQYDPVQVVGSFGIAGKAAVDILDGAIDGEFFSGVRDNPLWTREHDRHGNSTRVRNNNKGGTLSITLSASSPTNAILSAMAEADEFTENVVGILILRDLNGLTVVEADGVYIDSIPVPSFGNTRGDRVWTFQCGSMRVFLGGHALA